MPANVVNRTGLNVLYAASTATTGFPVDGSAPLPSASLPTGTGSSQPIDVQTWPAIRFLFGGTNAADETVNFQIIGWTQAGTSWFPMILAKGTYTLGATVMTVTALDTAATFIADTITESLGLPGTQVRSPGINAVADLTVRPGGCKLITVETDRGTADTASVYWSALDEPQAATISLNDPTINVGNVGLVNAAETEINPATEEIIAGSLIRKGAMTGFAAVTVDADTSAFEASIAIPAGTAAIRMGINAPCHVVVNTSATQIVAAPGKAMPQDFYGDLPCVGCTYLHLAKPVGGGNVTFEGAWVGAA